MEEWRLLFAKHLSSIFKLRLTVVLSPYVLYPRARPTGPRVRAFMACETRIQDLLVCIQPFYLDLEQNIAQFLGLFSAWASASTILSV